MDTLVVYPKDKAELKLLRELFKRAEIKFKLVRLDENEETAKIRKSKVYRDIERGLKEAKEGKGKPLSELFK